MAWGQAGPFAVEIVYLDGRKPTYHIFDDRNEAAAFRKKFLQEHHVALVRAWDLSGGWSQ